MGGATVSGCLPISVYDGSQSLPIAGTDPDELQAPIDDTVREGTGELRSPESGSWRTRADLEVCPRLNS